MSHPSRGFTLFEIMVTVTIIGVLVVTVLASLSSVRNRGNDTGLKSDLATIQTQSILYFGVGDTYGANNHGASASCSAVNTVFTDTSTAIGNTIVKTLTAALKDAGGGVIVCRSDSSTFVVAGKLSNSHFWCVDSIGSVVELAAQPATSATKCQ